MSEHTKEPWYPFIAKTTIAIFDSDKNEIISWVGFDSSPFPLSVQKANAKRIAACVNFCKGIPTSVLESEHVDAYFSTLKAQLDELLAERDKLLFHESQLVESLKSYMNKYGPGYSSTDTLAYDNAAGVLSAIANAEKTNP